jgi:predicted SprT family Zn-dependent metalloprotease
MLLKDVEKLADILFIEFCLKNFPGLKDWNLKFDNAKRRLGQCRFKEREIGISKEYAELNDEPRIKNTLLHEIAHALVGPGHGHDQIWKARAKEIGCDAKSKCEDEIVRPEPKFKAVCKTCGAEVPAHRKRRKNTACRICCDNLNQGKYSDLYILEFKKLK